MIIAKPVAVRFLQARRGLSDLEASELRSGQLRRCCWLVGSLLG